MKALLFLTLLLPLALQAAQWTSRPLAELAVYPEFRAPARVVAREEAKLAAEVSAAIVAMPVRAGEAVARGAELVRLDPAAFRIEVERARAQLRLVENRIRLARAQLEQSRALAGRGFISADGLRVRETEAAVLASERDAARAALAAAELALARCTIRAPYAGVVDERLLNVGDLATAGTPLLRFVASADAEVRARVPAGQVAALQTAGALTLVAGDGSYPLRIRRISPVLDAAGQVREVVLDSAAALPPGLAGELRWRSAVAHLPPTYLQQREGVLGAWVEREGKPAFVALPLAQAGRPAAVDWAASVRVIDEGRFGVGLAATPAAGTVQ